MTSRAKISDIKEPLTIVHHDQEPRLTYGYVGFLNDKGDIICMCREDYLFDPDGRWFSETENGQ